MPRAKKADPKSGAKASLEQTLMRRSDRHSVSADTRQPSFGSTDNASDSVLMLPDVLDSSAATDIRDSLLAGRGKPMIVDAAQVRRAGVQSLQVLIAAARAWRADGQSYCVVNPTEDLLNAVALIGLQRTDLMLEGSTP